MPLVKPQEKLTEKLAKTAKTKQKPTVKKAVHKPKVTAKQTAVIPVKKVAKPTPKEVVTAMEVQPSPAPAWLESIKPDPVPVVQDTTKPMGVSDFVKLLGYQG